MNAKLYHHLPAQSLCIAIEQELGARFSFEGTGPHRWILGPAKYNSQLGSRPKANAPEIFLDRDAGLLICDGPSCAEVIETLTYLRSLGSFDGGTFTITPCTDIEAATKRIQTEIATTYPAFSFRNLNWDAICTRFIPEVMNAAEPIKVMQEWVAALDDGHTWVRPSANYAEMPYGLFATRDLAIFVRVPEDSPGWQAGLRPGYELKSQELDRWWRRTASSSHAKPLITGRRILSVPAGTTVEVAAFSPTGQTIGCGSRIDEVACHPHPCHPQA